MAPAIGTMIAAQSHCKVFKLSKKFDARCFQLTLIRISRWKVWRVARSLLLLSTALRVKSRR